MNIINPYIHGGDEVAFDGFGNASRSFDGSTNYIDLGDSDDFSFGDGSNDSPFSISAWVKLDDITGTNKNLVGKYTSITNNDEYLLFFNTNNNEFRFSLYDSSAFSFIRVRSSLTIAADTWYHICVTYDGSGANTGMEMYIDGSLQTGVKDSNNTYVAMENGISPLTLGAYNSANYLEGNLADVRIYDTDLSSADITSLYNGTNITTNLVGHWIKDTPSLLDHAGNNDGTNYGSSWSPDNPSPTVEFGGASRSFDGVSDYVDLGNSNDFSFGDGANDSPFSVCFWAKLDSKNRFRAIGKNVSGSYEWLVSTDTAGLLTFYLISGTVFYGRRYNTALTENEWLHISATYDGTGGSNFRDGMAVYVNNVRVDDLDYGDNSYVAMTATSNPLEIAKYQTTYANGKMADVRLYDAELTASQVSDLYAGTDVQTNLVGHWLTNNDDVNDYAGTNHGTNFGSTYSFLDNPSDKVEYGGASRSFSSGDRVHVADNVDLPTGSQTVSVWAKLNQISQNQDLVTHWDIGDLSFIIYLPSGTNGQLRFYVSDDGSSNTLVQSTISLVASEWAHITCVFVPNTKMSIYIDGALAGEETSNIPSGLHDTAEKLSFGRRERYTATPLNGKLADVRIYDTDLSSTEIYELYKGVDHRTNLIGQWLTNSDDVEDKAGTNDGTNYGSTYSTDSPL